MDFWPLVLLVLHWAVLVLAIFTAVFSVLMVLLLAYSDRCVRRLAEVPLPADSAQPLPRISLIAGAKDEERNIEEAVRSLVAIDYPNLQITLVNDRSRDQTGAILSRLAAEYPQLNVVHVTELPAGWLGKNHALQLGADHSDGQWLLFTDADIVFERTALRRAISYAVTNQVDHLAATPDVNMNSWLLQAFVVTFSIFFTIFVKPWLIRNPNSSAHVGIGAFNLIRASVYQQIGRHEPIRMRPDDDMKLGKIVKQSGHKQDLVHGMGMIAVEWYSSLNEIIVGLEKNAFSGVDYRIWHTVLSSLFLLTMHVWPFLAVWIVPGPARWFYVAAVVVQLFMVARFARTMSIPLSTAFGFPLTVAIFTYIQWRAMILTFVRGGIRWRDTHYSLAELRANRV
ncbi:Poly-beta-1,6-N-acetyl-D-glucosamine synthase [Anatilimnocola aggregata]|uniref:Poly-beta-1,6-N-acetyl-D-glucosamine synthase n=1 Tax=Anatilimnocola aggregata TaxID=2528021 RepID=A0A517Y4M8_9BACT|nr:glycosyltransferase family 2 protein [Anatilimnocola aggregata]QDU25203.1 Poly-beta-1,6-N-acetyl-D-glucosamine synthase [Anatilimnocola aggregata]